MEIEFKDKKYSFSWVSIGLFFLLCPLLSIVVYLIFKYFWIFTYPPFVFPISSILTILTGKDFSYYLGASMYMISVSEQGDVGVSAACTGIYAYAIYLGICVSIPHNKHQNQNKSIWMRKFKTFLISSLAIYFYNIFRIVLTIILYSNGIPFNPLHENLSYTLTFFSVFFFYLISYYWLPEFSLFVIWMKNDLKRRISKLRAKQDITLIEQKDGVKKIQVAKKVIVIGLWIIICTILFVLLSILLV